MKCDICGDEIEDNEYYSIGQYVVHTKCGIIAVEKEMRS